MKLNPNYIFRRIGDEGTLVPFGSAVVDFNRMAAFNKVGSFLVELLQKERSLEDLVKATTARFKVDAETARRDVEAFVERLRADNLIVEEPR